MEVRKSSACEEMGTGSLLFFRAGAIARGLNLFTLIQSAVRCLPLRLTATSAGRRARKRILAAIAAKPALGTKRRVGRASERTRQWRHIAEPGRRRRPPSSGTLTLELGDNRQATIARLGSHGRQIQQGQQRIRVTRHCRVLGKPGILRRRVQQIRGLRMLLEQRRRG